MNMMTIISCIKLHLERNISMGQKQYPKNQLRCKKKNIIGRDILA